LFDDINTLEDIIAYLGCNPEDMNIILGEDWYIAYTINDSAIEITEWINVPREQDVLAQTTEMSKAMISILLLGEGKEIYATMRHHTSYKFYLKLKQLDYVEELSWWSQMEEERPLELDRIVEILKEKYDDLNEYFSDENREHFPEYAEYIFHDITFTVTDKFIQRYKKDSGKRLK
jgi:DNA-binding Xre family transcriptional regulator